jgi:hypothetical protein
MTTDFFSSVNLQISSAVPPLCCAREVPFLNVYLTTIVLQSFRLHAEIQRLVDNSSYLIIHNETHSINLPLQMKQNLK